MPLTRATVRGWLEETDPGRLRELHAAADAARRTGVGDEVHLRGLVEFSNRCARRCAYCGIHAGNQEIERYRMTDAEIKDCARRAVSLGLGTIVLQSGEDPGLDVEAFAGLIRDVKRTTGLAVTLSVGERSDDELRLWREAGADRYLLRFETSNERLFARVHPDAPGRSRDRLEQLRRMRELGYEIGTGLLVGLPGQTPDDLVEDVMRLVDLDPDMIGIGPYIEHPATPLAQAKPGGPPAGQVPNTSGMTCNVVALARLACPRANIPSTTALATVDPAAGRESALACGANVIMPNITPARYRILYEIYPGKPSPPGEVAEELAWLRDRLAAAGRPAASGRGDSPAWLARTQAEGGAQ